MERRRLGDSDLEVTEIGLGSWLTYGDAVPDRRARACLDAAFDAGIAFVDTANVLAAGGAESFLGRALARRPRDSYVLSTKVYFPMDETGENQGLSRGSRAADPRTARWMGGWLDEDVLERVQRLTPVAEKLGLTLPQLALAWILRAKDVASAIIGASRPEQVAANAAASGVTLDAASVAEIERALSS